MGLKSTLQTRWKMDITKNNISASLIVEDRIKYKMVNIFSASFISTERKTIL